MSQIYIHQRHCPTHLYEDNECQCLESSDEDIHCMRWYPEDHKHHHTPSSDCWCQPDVKLIYPDGSNYWLHREVQ